MRRLLVLAVLVFAHSAHAQSGQKREGDYGGVTPGEAPESKPGKPKRPPPRNTLTWIGFEAKDGGAQLFFQARSQFEVTQTLQGNALVVHLSLKKLGTNTWRQVDTRFFDNPLAMVKAATGRAPGKRGARGINVRITFKNPKDAREGALRTATEADGMFYAYLSFPPGVDANQPTLDEPEQ